MAITKEIKEEKQEELLKETNSTKIKLLNSLRHDEFVTVNGEQLMIPAQGNILVENYDSINDLPNGVVKIDLQG